MITGRVADYLRALADRLDRETAVKRGATDDALGRLGRWAYGGAPWTSTRTMLSVALNRAITDDSWRDVL